MTGRLRVDGFRYCDLNFTYKQCSSASLPTKYMYKNNVYVLWSVFQDGEYFFCKKLKSTRWLYSSRIFSVCLLTTVSSPAQTGVCKNSLVKLSYLALACNVAEAYCTGLVPIYVKVKLGICHVRWIWEVEEIDLLGWCFWSSFVYVKFACCMVMEEVSGQVILYFYLWCHNRPKCV